MDLRKETSEDNDALLIFTAHSSDCVARHLESARRHRDECRKKIEELYAYFQRYKKILVAATARVVVVYIIMNATSTARAKATCNLFYFFPNFFRRRREGGEFLQRIQVFKG